MLMEDDWTRPVSSVTTKDVTKYGLGARGIDVIIATTGITSSNEGTTSTAFPLYDGHGNMVNTLSRASGGSFALGNSSFRYYDAWGSLDTGPGAGNEPRQRYCANLGHLQDDESGLIYMRARYYEPGTGRFVSEDPAMEATNWLTYCHNDPLQYVYPKGKNPFLAALGEELTIAINIAAAINAGDVAGVVFWLEFATGAELSPAVVGLVSTAVATAQKVKTSAGAVSKGAGHFARMLEHIEKLNTILEDNPNSHVSSVVREINTFFRNWI